MDNLTLAYLLIGLGIVLLVGELFLPTGGVLFLFSVACFIGGVIMAFVYGQTYTGVITLVGVFVGVPVVGIALFYLWPHTPLGQRTLQPLEDGSTVASMPGVAELEQYRGRYGRTVSPMRPARSPLHSCASVACTASARSWPPAIASSRSPDFFSASSVSTKVRAPRPKQDGSASRICGVKLPMRSRCEPGGSQSPCTKGVVDRVAQLTMSARRTAA